MWLLKVFHAAFKQGHVLLSGNVDGHRGAPALQMAHLAKNPAVGEACIRAGIDPEIVVIRNLTTDFLAQSAQALEQAIRGAQMVVLPGGFSGGDEPEGSGKFIASFLRNPALSDAIMDLLKNRDGLMLGICNGFQALCLQTAGERPSQEMVCTASDVPALVG